MTFVNFPRGTSGILSRARDLVNFARRYDYVTLMSTRTGDSAVGDAIGSLIAAVDAFAAGDNNPWEADAVSPSSSPEDQEVA